MFDIREEDTTVEKEQIVLEKLKEINKGYELSYDEIDKILLNMETARVCVPIIGKFSSGKSAVFNGLLGYVKKILKEDITPETAVPTEIIYEDMEREEPVTIFYQSGEKETYTIQEYREMTTSSEDNSNTEDNKNNSLLNVNKVKCVRLHLKNSFMEAIKDVKLVDMPGFESGIELHNMAIDNYLSESSAYLVAFPADDMVLRNSIGNILKELCLYDMPLCILITKKDKVTEEILLANLENLKKNLRRYIGEKKYSICITSAADGEIDELKRFLINEIQENAEEILSHKYQNQVKSEIHTTEQYLNAVIKSSELSESELLEREDSLNHQMEELNTNISSATKDFEKQLEGCVDGIKSDVMSALNAQESTFVSLILNNQSINEQVNVVVRNAVTQSVQKRFVSIVQKYIDKVTNNICIDTITTSGIMMNIDTNKIETNMVTSIVAGAAAGLLIGFPIIGGIIAAIISGIVKSSNSKKREEAKGQIRQKLHGEVFPDIIQRVGTNVENEIAKQVVEIKAAIQDNIIAQRDTLEKALQDLKTRQKDEEEKKEQLMNHVQEDIQLLQQLKADIED